MPDRKLQRFLQTLRAHWPRPELSPSEAAAFDARLRRRLQARPRVRGWGAVALAAAAGAAAVLWLAGEPNESTNWVDALAAADGEISAEPAAASDQVAAWLSSPALDGSLNEILPTHYQAMAEWLAPGADPATTLNPNQ